MEIFIILCILVVLASNAWTSYLAAKWQREMDKEDLQALRALDEGEGKVKNEG